jgi:hypothetical protein
MNRLDKHVDDTDIELASCSEIHCIQEAPVQRGLDRMILSR